MCNQPSLYTKRLQGSSYMAYREATVSTGVIYDPVISCGINLWFITHHKITRGHQNVGSLLTLLKFAFPY